MLRRPGQQETGDGEQADTAASGGGASQAITLDGGRPVGTLSRLTAPPATAVAR